MTQHALQEPEPVLKPETELPVTIWQHPPASLPKPPSAQVCVCSSAVLKLRLLSALLHMTQALDCKYCGPIKIEAISNNGCCFIFLATYAPQK